MNSRQSRVNAQLREMILNGEFAAGQHLAESALAKRLGVSRTPIRVALNILEQEGLVSSFPNRGFRVEAYSVGDISDAIDVRGTLEGMAARLVAEHGLTRRAALQLHRCLDDGDRILAGGDIRGDEIGDFGELNGRFHDTIVEACGNTTLDSSLKATHKLPFVAPRAIVIHDSIDVKRQMTLAHTQHHLIVEALEIGQGTRAEALMREHALVSKTALNVIGEAIEEGLGSSPSALRLVKA